MTQGTPITIQNVTSMFLYGTMTPPAEFDLRLRPASVVDVHTTVDVASFMGSVGRYANLFQTRIVQAFFSDQLNLSSFANPSGVVHVTFQDIIQASILKSNTEPWTKADGNVTVNQYTTDTGSTDWAMRAFVFGSTGFTLSVGHTVFNIDSNGVKSISGGAMLPYQDNFDLGSHSKIAQAANYLVFKDLVDPYGIGRTVWFDFTEVQKTAYAQSQSNDVYTAADQPGFLANFVSELGHIFSIPTAAANALANSIDLKQQVADGADYIHDNHNVVFGSNDGSIMANDYGKGTLFDPTLKKIFVGGKGADTIELTGGDRAYAGAGDDIILVSHVNDPDPLDHATIVAGGGADQVKYINSGSPGHRQHQDIWTDAETLDTLFFNGTALTGGTTALAAGGEYLAHFGDGPVEGTFRFINADDNAAYEFDTSQSNDLEVFFAGGNSILLQNYQQGLGGMDVAPASDIYYSDLEAGYPSMRGAIFGFDMDGFYHQGIKTVHIERYDQPM